MGTLELTGSPLEPHLDGIDDRLQAPVSGLISCITLIGRPGDRVHDLLRLRHLEIPDRPVITHDASSTQSRGDHRDDILDAPYRCGFDVAGSRMEVMGKCWNGYPVRLIVPAADSLSSFALPVIRVFVGAIREQVVAHVKDLSVLDFDHRYQCIRGGCALETADLDRTSKAVVPGKDSMQHQVAG